MKEAPGKVQARCQSRVRSMSVLLPGSPGPLGSPETQRTLAGSAPVFWEEALWCCSPWSCAPRVTARAGWTGRRSGAQERVRVQEDAVRWSCPGQSGVVPGWEAQKTFLIGPGGRLYHIRELGPGRAGTSLSGLPQPGRDAPRCQHWGPKTLSPWGFRSPAGVCCLWRHPWHCIVSFRHF